MTKVLADAIIIAGGNGRKVLNGEEFYSKSEEKRNATKTGFAFKSAVLGASEKVEDRSMGM